ncbi:hypothetical protein HAX54_018707 [Datura stramonium]|uniref:PTC1-like winged helix-turn-helix domain-containing protein n=1 Tax=Datura stramonium TaxID=4076 RepID=A0ABS8UPV3_DATST|nr:hypothetical protein [Datura stramonium]
MSGKEAGDAARLHIGNLGLHYVLKSMNNVIVVGYVVHRVVNQAMSALGYLIQELRNVDQPEKEKLPSPIVLDSKQFVKVWPFRVDLDESLLRFICCILLSSSGLKVVLAKGYPH